MTQKMLPYHIEEKGPLILISTSFGISLPFLEDNPYVHTFKRNDVFPNLDDYRIELNTNVTPDQRRYNAPTTS